MAAGDYDGTIGTLLIGIFFNTYLYGLVTYQFAAYHRAKFNDRLELRLMVLFLFLLDTVHSAAVIYMAWVYVVTNYDQPAALTNALWPYTFTPIATALAALLTQIFLGHRIWRLSGSNVLFGIVILLAIPSCILGFLCGIKAWIIKVLVELPQINNLVTGWLVMQVIADAFVTGTLSIILARSRTGFRKTDTVINRLIRGAIQTGLFAGIFSLCDLLTFLELPTTNLYGMFAIPIGRIYTNTLLDTLLSRQDLRNQMASGTAVNMDSMSAWGPSQGSRPGNVHQLSELEIRKEVQVVSDTGSFETKGAMPIPEEP
ncbi:hypothetical protein CONPUDRAFT_82882 [Coniophora puteana RWD-64-598 SS2]|uniref:DUF6534 domain-containing protein n=1 Tax=Coniophora puteana (strain RWD-64-598) TaxID=741705 RepID=A0A5M3MK64_CONPW|nr:uncharacterized protein CONPUDRAFT_82882 [Coniophora puteana RWD-64-598 SS2]EIW79453.1 hypothetical protein CONPUDRAFT_82882 [Coniophora puteana RWD-64-598 SS2]